VCISWTIKCLILLMQGATVKFSVTTYFVCYVVYDTEVFCAENKNIRAVKVFETRRIATQICHYNVYT